MPVISACASPHEPSAQAPDAMRVVKPDEPLAAGRMQCERIRVWMHGALRRVALEGDPSVIAVLEDELIPIVIFQSGETACASAMTHYLIRTGYVGQSRWSAAPAYVTRPGARSAGLPMER